MSTNKPDDQYLEPEESLEAVRIARNKNLREISPHSDDANGGSAGESRDLKRSYRGAVPGYSTQDIEHLPLDTDFAADGEEGADEDEVHTALVKSGAEQVAFDPEEEEEKLETSDLDEPEQNLVEDDDDEESDALEHSI